MADLTSEAKVPISTTTFYPPIHAAAIYTKMDVTWWPC